MIANIQFQPNAGSDTSPKCKDKNAIESDSDQDFEILAKPNAKSLSSQSLAKFNGIYIKEDHFAEGTEDGSDIEVIKTTDKIKGTFNSFCKMTYGTLYYPSKWPRCL